MHVRCDGMFYYHSAINLLLSWPVKEFWKVVNTWQVRGKKYSGTFFLNTV